MNIRLLANRETFGYAKIPYEAYVSKLSVLKKEEYPTLNEEGDPIPPMACQFGRVDKTGHILAVADEDGAVVLKDTNHTALGKGWFAHHNAIFDLCWAPTLPQLLTASGDKTIKLWDVETSDVLGTFRGHSSSVKSVFYRDNCIFGSGGRDGNFYLWDTRVSHGAFIAKILSAHPCQSAETAGKKPRYGKSPGPPQSVTAVVFAGEDTVVTSGSVNGIIKLWDLRKLQRYCKKLPEPLDTYQSRNNNGFASMAIDTTGTRLFASCMDKQVYEWNLTVQTKEPVNNYWGHCAGSFYVKLCLSPDNNFLLSGSSDGAPCVWPTNSYKPAPIKLEGHDGEVGAVAWCPQDHLRLVTCSDDSFVRIWRLNQEGDLLTVDMNERKVGRAVPTGKPTLRSFDTVSKYTHLRQCFAGSPSKSPSVARLLISPTKGLRIPQSPGRIQKMMSNLPSKANSQTPTKQLRTPATCRKLSKRRASEEKQRTCVKQLKFTDDTSNCATNTPEKENSPEKDILHADDLVSSKLQNKQSTQLHSPVSSSKPGTPPLTPSNWLARLSLEKSSQKKTPENRGKANRGTSKSPRTPSNKSTERSNSTPRRKIISSPGSAGKKKPSKKQETLMSIKGYLTANVEPT